jgi:hypothetical protein
MAAMALTYDFIFERPNYTEESIPTVVMYVAFIIATAPLLCPYLVFWICKEWACGRPPKVRQKIERSEERETMRCGWAVVQSGGTLIAQTDDMIEIVTREGTETMTVAEYNARKEKQSEQGTAP